MEDSYLQKDVVRSPWIHKVLSKCQWYLMVKIKEQRKVALGSLSVIRLKKVFQTWRSTSKLFSINSFRPSHQGSDTLFSTLEHCHLGFKLFLEHPPTASAPSHLWSDNFPYLKIPSFVSFHLLHPRCLGINYNGRGDIFITICHFYRKILFFLKSRRKIFAFWLRGQFLESIEKDCFSM